MLSISRHQSPAQAATYYTGHDDYHLHDDGIWQGKAAESLGLIGIIKKEDYLKLLDGFGPDGKKLVASAGSKPVLDMDCKIKKIGHRAGCDMTYSAPKSVSALAYKDEKIVKIFMEAVTETNEYAEQRYAYKQTKQTSGYVTADRVEGLVWAKFLHRTSREKDPQIHCHCFLMNVAKEKSGKYKTVNTDPIFKHQKHLGLVFRAKLAKKLKGLGYAIAWDKPKAGKPDEGFFEIAGANAPEFLKAISKRRTQVENELEILKKDERYRNYTASALAQEAALRTRKHKTSGDTEEELRKITEDINKTCENYGYASLEGLESSAKSYAAAPEAGEKSAKKILAGVIEDITDFESAFTREEVLSGAIKEAFKTGMGGNYGVEDFEAAFADLQKTGEISYLDTVHTKAGNREVFSSREILEAEKAVIEMCEAGKNKFYGRPQRLATQYNLDKQRELYDKGCEFTVGQIEGLSLMTKTVDRYSYIQGDAGAGKSYSCYYAREYLENQGYCVRGLAPTGKAASGLKSAAKIQDCNTIDSFLIRHEKMKTAAKTAKKPFPQTGGKPEVWLVDEAGMIGSKKFYRLMKAAEEANAQVTFIGDTKQFPSVEAGRMFADIQKTGIDGRKMREAIRQKSVQAKELVAAFKKTFEGDGVDKAFDIMDKYKMLEEEPDEARCMRLAANKYVINIISYGKDTMLITNTNKDKDALNNIIRTELVNKDYIENGIPFATLRKPDKKSRKPEEIPPRRFGKGDTIMFLYNNKRIGVYNGDTAKILDINPDGTVTAKLADGGKQVIFNLNEGYDNTYRYIDYAYAMTSHKSQGATTGEIIWYAPTQGSPISLNNSYVAVTRCREDINIYTTDITELRQKIKTERRKESTLDYTSKPKPVPPKPLKPTPVIAAKKSGRERLNKILEMIQLSITNLRKQPEILENKASHILPVREQKPMPGLGRKLGFRLKTQTVENPIQTINKIDITDW
jgi:conjugative relaxase-like TrwC/TraI family protein